MQTITVKGEGITLDLLLWRAYGVRGRSLIERSLSLNVDMARLGTVIPMGTKVIPPRPASGGCRPFPRSCLIVWIAAWLGKLTGGCWSMVSDMTSVNASIT